MIIPAAASPFKEQHFQKCEYLRVWKLARVFDGAVSSFEPSFQHYQIGLWVDPGLICFHGGARPRESKMSQLQVWAAEADALRIFPY